MQLTVNVFESESEGLVSKYDVSDLTCHFPQVEGPFINQLLLDYEDDLQMVVDSLCRMVHDDEPGINIPERVDTIVKEVESKTQERIKSRSSVKSNSSIVKSNSSIAKSPSVRKHTVHSNAQSPKDAKPTMLIPRAASRRNSDSGPRPSISKPTSSTTIVKDCS
ncbi:hypothetical protein BC833DRAFT_583669 [Globomyces pollinis-pini]|nr:hypothetical protein BC833DRAFT_583669 [Globomyces pollinis-pini]